jgi:hypothetical protein
MTQGEARGKGGPGAESCRWICDTAERTVAALGNSLRIKVDRPGRDSQPGLLSAIRAFRAEVYYADGRRPSFRAPDGRFADPDDADLHAHHITCHDDDGVLVGCLRARRSGSSGRCSVPMGKTTAPPRPSARPLR